MLSAILLAIAVYLGISAIEDAVQNQPPDSPIAPAEERTELERE